MSAEIVIIDYGVGNLMSVSRAVSKAGGTARLTHKFDEIVEAERVLLPGVGAFGDCIAALRAHDGLEDAIRSFVDTGRPLLGICVGMQILFDIGEEFGEHCGLSLIPGRVAAVPDTDIDGRPQKIPHIGWIPLEVPAEADAECWRGTILDGLRPHSEMYFVHSFTAWPKDPAHRLADVHYGRQRISAVVKKDNITGTQFHPEKSGEAGLNLLGHFLRS